MSTNSAVPRRTTCASAIGGLRFSNCPIDNFVVMSVDDSFGTGTPVGKTLQCSLLIPLHFSVNILYNTNHFLGMVPHATLLHHVVQMISSEWVLMNNKFYEWWRYWRVNKIKLPI